MSYATSSCRGRHALRIQNSDSKVPTFFAQQLACLHKLRDNQTHAWRIRREQPQEFAVATSACSAMLYAENNSIFCRTYQPRRRALRHILTHDSSMRFWKSDSKAPSEGSTVPLSETGAALLACSRKQPSNQMGAMAANKQGAKLTCFTLSTILASTEDGENSGNVPHRMPPLCKQSSGDNQNSSRFCCAAATVLYTRHGNV